MAGAPTARSSRCGGFGPDVVCSSDPAYGERAAIHRPFFDRVNLGRNFGPDKLAPVSYSAHPSKTDPATDAMQFQKKTQIFLKRGGHERASNHCSKPSFCKASSSALLHSAYKRRSRES